MPWAHDRSTPSSATPGHTPTTTTPSPSWIFGERWSAGQASLDFRDFSVPKDDPIHDVSSTKALREAIFNQIAKSHVVVIPSGIYATHSKWIQKEIDGAKNYAKPILAVNPWGQQRRAGVVLDISDDGVGWNKQPLITAIWSLYYARNPYGIWPAMHEAYVTARAYSCFGDCGRLAIRSLTARSQLAGSNRRRDTAVPQGVVATPLG